MVRWAIVGTGYIANRFAQGMMVAEGAKLEAVVSRKQETGEAFAAKYGCSCVCTDYEEMLRQVKPDIVYLAIPNDCHYEYIMKALDNGVPVLPEKPIVDTVSQLEEVYAKAKEKNLLVIEGMWTRCFPVVRKVREWIREGRIGEPMSVNVNFGFKADMEHWEAWKAGIAHAGGSLRDVGIYSLAVANMVFPQEPDQVFSICHNNGEVDDDCSLLLDYGSGKAAYATGSFIQNTATTVRINGSEGEITFGPEFWMPYEACLTSGDVKETFTQPYEATGFQYEIMEAQKTLLAGELESPHFTHAESLLIARIIEDARKKWGIIYEADKA